MNRTSLDGRHGEATIAYLSSADIPSATANSMHVMKMCQALTQEGNHATLITPDYRGKQAPPAELWHQYGIVTPFPFLRIPARKLLRGVDFDLKSVLYARRQQPRLLYTRSFRQAALSTWIGIPTIFEAHDIPRGRLGNCYFSHILRHEKTLRTIAITKALKQALRASVRGDSQDLAENITIEPDGVDLDQFGQPPSPHAARLSLGLEPAPFMAGYAGHLYSGRGIELILELAIRRKEVSFLLLGGMPEDICHWKQETARRKAANVIFKGIVPNAELPRYLAACDVLLMPYQDRVSVSGGGNTVQWMSPMKMFEYLAAGRLILSSDLPVLREVLNERNCVLCGTCDIAAWTEALARAQKDPLWRTQLEGQARKDAERYSWRARVRRILDGIRL